MGELFAQISAVEYWLPENTLTNDDISASFPQWSVEKISKKTGISVRHIAAENEYSSDLAAKAVQRLLDNRGILPDQIEFIILCTQSPDYFMPTTAALVQELAGIPTTAGALDVNLGCSGYVYSLGVAKGLIESGQVNNALVVTADTYSKFLNPEDKSVRTIFGDGASATFVTGNANRPSLDGFSFGTDGSGGKHLMVPNGGLRPGSSLHASSSSSNRGLASNGYDLYMNGPEIFNFTLRVVPDTVHDILRKAKLRFQDIDLFVFHQANAYMLEHLRKKLNIDEAKFFISMAKSGNTVSSTIPIALADAETSGVLQKGMKVMLLGFGVGLSWGGLVATW